MTPSLDAATLVPVVVALVGAGCVSGLLAGLFGIGGGAVVVISLFSILVARSSVGDVLKWVWVLMGSFLAVRMALGRDDWRLLRYAVSLAS